MKIYYELVGQGPPMLLLHGLGMNGEEWKATGYFQGLRKEYSLILVDARGHGRSDKPHEPEAYKLGVLVNDLVAVLDDQDLNRGHFLGYSMGGWIGYGIAKYAPQRFSSLIIGGAQPYDQSPWKQNMLRLYQQGADAHLAAVKQIWGSRMTPQIETRVLEADREALIALTTIRERLNLLDTLQTSPLPMLLFVGENDEWQPVVKECSKHIPNATLITIPNLDHIDAFYQSDHILPHITQFLAQIKPT